MDEIDIMAMTAIEVIDELDRLPDVVELAILREWFCSTWNNPSLQRVQHSHAVSIADELCSKWGSVE